MRFQPIERGVDAFQRPVSAEQVLAMCARAFGDGADVVSAVEIGDGSYNNTYRIEFGDADPVILRVAPEPHRQNRIEREFMRDEYAALPHFAPIAAMMPRTLFADWTRDIAGRDYVVQTLLPGESISSGALERYPRSEWGAHYRQLGALARTVHEIRGTRYGPIAGPTFPRWSEAVLSLLDDTIADLADAALPADDLERVAKIAAGGTAVLDEIDTPHLLHGDLWSNVMLDPTAPTPTITGLIDHDRASWGDPWADWTIFMATRRRNPQRDQFWTTYGPLDESPAATWRLLVYRAAHLGAVRLERHRAGRHDTIQETYADVSDVLIALTS